MSKLFNMVAAIMLTINTIIPSFMNNVLVSATQTNNISSQSSTLSSSGSLETSSNSSSISSSNSIFSASKSISKTKKKVKVVNNEIQVEVDVILNKKDQERYDKCKKDVAIKRVKRFKNKPTPCLKMINTEGNKDAHITPEDYNILWATVAENKDLIDNKVDPNFELPLSTYLNLDEMEIVNNSSSSSALSLSSIISTTNNSQSSFSSVSDVNSMSSSSAVVSTSNSSSITTLSTTSTSSSTNQNSLSSNSNTSSNIFPASIKATASSSKTSWLNNILNLGTIKASAAINDGFRLPYENGVSVRLEQTSFNESTGGIWGVGKHASHWDYAAFDLTGTGNKKIAASKPGKVVYSAPKTTGFGNHIIIEHSDGSHALYAHLNSRKVIVGDIITQAQYIGDEGTSGGVPQHLHFETFNRYPCDESSVIETCFEYNSTGYLYSKGKPYYLASVMRPTFVECTNNNKCTNGYPDVAYEYFTSQNKPIYNNYGGFIKATVNDQLVFEVEGSNTADQTPVKLAQGKWSGDNMNQRWGYDQATKQIKGLNDKCLDAGNVSDPNNRWLRIQTCNDNNNQKWERDNAGRVHNLADYNQCIDGYGGGVYAGQTVAAWNCHGYDNQRWNVADLGMPLPAPIVDSTMDRVQPPLNAWDRALDSNCRLNTIIVIKYRDNGDCQKLKYDSGTNSIRNPFGQCIDAGNMNGTQKLVFYSCNNSSNQKWFHESGNGRIWSQQKDNTNKYRCIEYSALNDGDEVYILPCSTDSRQRWYTFDIGISQAPVPNTQVTAFNNYSQEIWSDTNSGFRFDVSGANPQDGTSVTLYTTNNSIAQKWGYDSGTQQIKGLNDKCLDAGDVNNPNNRWLRISTCHNGNNQKWFLDNINRIHSEAKTSLCIDSSQGNTQNSLLYMGACHNGNNQRWAGNLSMARRETFYPLRSAYGQGFGFDIYQANNTNQTPIRMWQLGNNSWNQSFEYNSTTQEIRNRNGKCVDAGNYNDPNNRWLRINDCHNGIHQKWYTDGDNRIHSSGNGLCVDSYSGDSNNSTLYLGGCHNGNNQKWWIQGWLS
jgi:murein DD-endopeptidase MepM/ murein hydrolase activator NlpD